MGSRATMAMPGLVAAGGAAYSWWATGIGSFTALADVAVGIPVVAVAAVALSGAQSSRQRPDPVSRSRYRWPWAVLAALAVALEATALGLGGKSRSFPSLSTVIDQAFAAHAGRFFMFLAWLATGVLPAALGISARRKKRTAEPLP